MSGQLNCECGPRLQGDPCQAVGATCHACGRPVTKPRKRPRWFWPCVAALVMALPTWGLLNAVEKAREAADRAH